MVAKVRVEVLLDGYMTTELPDRGGFALVYDIIQMLKATKQFNPESRFFDGTRELCLDSKVYNGDAIQILTSNLGGKDGKI